MQRWKSRLAEVGEIETFDCDYMGEGRKRPDRLPQLVAAHRAALTEARTGLEPGTAIFLIKEIEYGGHDTLPSF